MIAPSGHPDQGQRLLRGNGEAYWSILTALVIQVSIVVSGVLVARTLGAENRGHLQLLSIVPTIIGQLGFLGLPLAVTYYLARSPDHQEHILRLLKTRLLIAGTVLLLLHGVTVAVFFRDSSGQLQAAAAATLLAGPGGLAQVYGLAILQGQRRFKAFNALRSAQILTYSCAVFFLFAAATDSLALVTATWSVSVAFGGVITLAIAHRSQGATPLVSSGDGRPPRLGEMQAFGLKSLAGWTNIFESFRVDQILVGLVIGPTALGLYVVALALTNLPRFVSQSIGLVAYPRIAAARSGQRRLILRYMGLATLTCGVIVIALEVVCGSLIPFFFGSAFEAAVPVTRISLLAALLMSLKRVLHDCARGLGKPGLGLRAELVSWIPLLPGFLAIGDTLEGIAWLLVGSAALGLCVLVALIVLDKQVSDSTQNHGEMAIGVRAA